MTFNSEAQAYQAIRKDWKHRRNVSQRQATIHQWELNAGEVHPNIRRRIAFASKVDVSTIHMATNSPEVARESMLEAQYWVSRYQFMLDKFKVEENNETI